MNRTFVALPLLLFVVFSQLADAKDPLHKRIDRIIEGASMGGTSVLATDADFVRRVYLDLTGRIPTSDQARSFLDDKSKDKRSKLIDALLKSPQFSIHMAKAFDVMLMERLGNKHVTSAEWETYLRSAFDTNKPFNRLAAEILGADGVDPKKRAPARFILDRDAEVNRVTRDVGRMFFGIDLQCAQCHNHPLIDDYLQSDYYGIYAFLSRSYLYKTKKMKKSVLAERPEGGVNFTSVFTKLQGEAAAPRLPGDLDIAEPTIAKDKMYIVKPAKNVRPVPRYSRRAQLASLVSKGTNQAFNKNISNRLWAMVMGRGLVEPVDLHHSANPSSHPQLTQILADEFAAMKYDVRSFLRELLLSRSYQRSIEMPSDLLARAQSASKQVAALKKVHAERDKASTKALDAFNSADEKHSALVKELVPLFSGKSKATKAIAAANKALAAATKAAGSLEQTLASKQQAAKLLTEAAQKLALAVKARPKDKGLAQTAANVKAQAAAATKTATALAKSAGPKIKAKKSAQAQLAAAKKSEANVDGQLAALRKRVAAAYKIVNDSRTKWQTTNAETTFAERRVLAAEALAQFAKLDIAKTAADKAVQAQLAKVKPLAAQVKQLRQTMAKETATRDAAVKRSGQLTAKTKSLRTQLTAQQKLAPLLKAAADKAAAALKLVPKDAKLKTTLALLSGQVQDSAAATKKLELELKAGLKELATAQSAATAATKRAADATKKLQPQNKQLLSLRSQLGGLQRKALDADSAWNKHYMELTDSWSKRFAVAPLSPLSPEQLAWSIMVASGLENRQRASATATVAKKFPVKKSKISAIDRARKIEAEINNKLKGNVSEFVKLFSPGAGQPQNQFFATPDQALFLANGTRVRGWLSPGSALVSKLTKMKDDGKMCEEMYLSVLSRRPTIAEFADIKAYLAKTAKDAKKRGAAVQEIVWSLVASSEFRFKH